MPSWRQWRLCHSEDMVLAGRSSLASFIFAAASMARMRFNQLSVWILVKNRRTLQAAHVEALIKSTVFGKFCTGSVQTGSEWNSPCVEKGEKCVEKFLGKMRRKRGNMRRKRGEMRRKRGELRRKRGKMRRKRGKSLRPPSTPTPLRTSQSVHTTQRTLPY